MEYPKPKYFNELYKIAIAVNSPLKVKGVLRATVRNTVRAMNVKGCSIMLFTPDRKSVIHKISFGLSRTFISKGPRLVKKSLPETVKGKGRVTIVYDVNEERQRVQYPEAAIKEGIVSIIAAPMKVKNKILGELRIYTSERRDFAEDDIFFVQAVANLSALALDSARLYETTENLLLSI